MRIQLDADNLADIVGNTMISALNLHWHLCVNLFVSFTSFRLSGIHAPMMPATLGLKRRQGRTVSKVRYPLECLAAGSTRLFSLLASLTESAHAMARYGPHLGAKPERRKRKWQGEETGAPAQAN